MTEALRSHTWQVGERFSPYKMFHASPVPEWLERRWELGPLSKLVYARLLRYAGADGRAFPTMAALGAALGAAPETVRTHVRVLRDLGLIEVERRGLGKSNSYHFLVHEWNVEWLDSQTPSVKPTRPVSEGTTDRAAAPGPSSDESHDIRESELREPSNEIQRMENHEENKLIIRSQEEMQSSRVQELLKDYSNYLANPDSEETLYERALAGLREVITALANGAPISQRGRLRPYLAEVILRDRVPVEGLWSYLSRQTGFDAW